MHRNPRLSQPPVGASPEVIRHHAAQHQKMCGCVGGYVHICPCGRAHLLRCDRDLPVFVAVMPGTMCQHAVAAMREQVVA